MTVTRSLVDRLRTAGCVFAEDEARFIAAAAPDAVALEEMVTRRIAGEPLEYIVGWAEFDGLRIAVDPGVFVPRRRTELLVREAVAAIQRLPDPVSYTHLTLPTIYSV